jgi:hypothetical protein
MAKKMAHSGHTSCAMRIGKKDASRPAKIPGIKLPAAPRRRFRLQLALP